MPITDTSRAFGNAIQSMNMYLNEFPQDKNECANPSTIGDIDSCWGDTISRGGQLHSLGKFDECPMSTEEFVKSFQKVHYIMTPGTKEFKCALGAYNSYTTHTATFEKCKSGTLGPCETEK